MCFRRQNQVVIMMKGCGGKTNNSWPSPNSAERREIAIPSRNINSVCPLTHSHTHILMAYAFTWLQKGFTIRKFFPAPAKRSFFTGNCTVKLLQQQAGVRTHKRSPLRCSAVSLACVYICRCRAVCIY